MTCRVSRLNLNTHHFETCLSIILFFVDPRKSMIVVTDVGRCRSKYLLWKAMNHSQEKNCAVGCNPIILLKRMRFPMFCFPFSSDSLFVLRDFLEQFLKENLLPTIFETKPVKENCLNLSLIWAISTRNWSFHCQPLSIYVKQGSFAMRVLL